MRALSPADTVFSPGACTAADEPGSGAAGADAPVQLAADFGSALARFLPRRAAAGSDAGSKEGGLAVVMASSGSDHQQYPGTLRPILCAQTHFLTLLPQEGQVFFL